MIWKTMSQDDRVRVTNVSRSWRTLAMHTPHLWSRIEIETTVHSEDCDCDICLGLPDKQPHNLHIIPLLLARNDSLELRVTVRTMYGEDDYDVVSDDIARLETVVEILRSDLHRIERLQVAVDEPRHVKMVMQAFNGAVFPQLRELEFDYYGKTARFSQIDPSKPFIESPTVLAAYNLDRIWSFRPWFLWPEQPQACMHKLSALAIRVSGISDIATIIFVCSSLRHLRLYVQALDVDVDSSTDRDFHAPTTYPALDILEVDCIYSRLELTFDDDSGDRAVPLTRIWEIIRQLAVNARQVDIVYPSKMKSCLSTALRCGLTVLSDRESEMISVINVRLGDFAGSDGWEGDMITLTLREEPASKDAVGRTCAITFHPDVLEHFLKLICRYIDPERIQRVELRLEATSVGVCDEVEEHVKSWVSTAEVLVTHRISL